MKAQLQSVPLWIRIALAIYVVALGWLVIARVSGSEQQIVLEEPLELAGRPTLGREDAPVSIVIFSDFQCSYCRDFDREVLPRLEREFVETGNAKITFLHYPFMSEDSYRAALAAECVYQQKPEAFWAYKSAVFELRQPFGRWATDEKLLQAAQPTAPDVSLDSLKLCLNVQQGEKQIEADKALAESLEIDQVPKIFANQISVPLTYPGIVKSVNSIQ